jgi:hypothetical protein
LLHHVTGRSQHNALDALATGITRTKVNWISDCDIRSYFDSVSHEWLVRFIEHRIGDPRMIRLIRKWLKAGVHDDGKWSTSDTGTPHGAVVTPRTHKVISADRYFVAAVGVGAILSLLCKVWLKHTKIRSDTPLSWVHAYLRTVARWYIPALANDAAGSHAIPIVSAHQLL